MDLHVFPILNPPPTSLPIPSLWVFPVHQPWAPVYHNFFIHYSVDGHLGSFYVLAIIYGAAVNIRVHGQHSVLKVIQKGWKRKLYYTRTVTLGKFKQREYKTWFNSETKSIKQKQTKPFAVLKGAIYNPII